jgi:hypothetical protein
VDNIHWITGIETGRAIDQIRLKTVSLPPTMRFVSPCGRFGHDGD